MAKNAQRKANASNATASAQPTSNDIHMDGDYDEKTDTITQRYKVRKNENSEPFTKTTVFDFTDCTRADLCELAMYGIRVKLQSMLRGLSESEIANPEKYARVMVKTDLANRTRRSADPTTKAKNALDKLDPAIAAELVARYLKQHPVA